jgi:hypothetical protein
VHDQVGVRVRDGRQHVEEQAQAGLDSQPPLVAVAVDRPAFHVLEHQIRLAAAQTRIDEACDVGVVQQRKEAPLAPEPLLTAAPHERDVQELDRRTSCEAAVAAFAQPHAAHPALPDRRDQPVGADRLPGERRWLARRRQRVLEEALLEDCVLLVEQLQVDGERRVLGRRAASHVARSSRGRSIARSR